MKILFHINSLGLGGAERVVSILSNALCKEGHSIVLATEWTSEREYALDERIARFDVGLSPKQEEKNRISKIILRHLNLRKCIQKEKPDIVISFCVKANYRAAISMLGMKIPLLVSVRNDPKIDYAPHPLSTRMMERKANGCVFQTKEAMSFFSSSFQKKSTIVYNPLTNAFLEEAEQLYRDLPKKPDGTVCRRKEIVAVGRITAQKNHRLLVKVFADLAADYPDYVLRIYGEHENAVLTDELETFIKDKKLEKQIFLMPPSKQIQKEIIDAALFVLPSDYEGMPNSLIEALALGLPCISTDCPCGGPAMLIEDKVSGLLVPVGDPEALKAAMSKLLKDAEYAESLGLTARKIKDTVNEEAIVSEWTALIQKLIGKR